MHFRSLCSSSIQINRIKGLIKAVQVDATHFLTDWITHTNRETETPVALLEQMLYFSLWSVRAHSSNSNYVLLVAGATAVDWTRYSRSRYSACRAFNSSTYIFIRFDVYSYSVRIINNHAKIIYMNTCVCIFNDVECLWLWAHASKITTNRIQTLPSNRIEEQQLTREMLNKNSFFSSCLLGQQFCNNHSLCNYEILLSGYLSTQSGFSRCQK